MWQSEHCFSHLACKKQQQQQKTPLLMWWLKQQKTILSQFWSLEVWDQGGGVAESRRGPDCWVRRLSPRPVLTRPFLVPEREDVNAFSRRSILMRTADLSDQGFHWTWITSLKALLPNTVTLGIRASTCEFRIQAHNSVHNKCPEVEN